MTGILNETPDPAFAGRTHSNHCDWCGARFDIPKWGDACCPMCDLRHEWREQYSANPQDLCTLARKSSRQQTFNELRDVFSRPTFKVDTDHDRQIVLDVIGWRRGMEPPK